jgi:hypothetical protein
VQPAPVTAGGPAAGANGEQLRLRRALEKTVDASKGLAVVAHPFDTAFIRSNYTILAPWYMLDSHE